MNTLESETEALKENFENTKATLHEQMDATLKKNKQKISNIKDICSKYFENYDATLKGMQDRVKSVNQTFEDWTKHVMKPAQLSEARLFSVETRLKEEEDMRILQLNHMRDVQKKLIFAIEQANLSSRELLSTAGSVFPQNPRPPPQAEIAPLSATITTIFAPGEAKPGTALPTLLNNSFQGGSPPRTRRDEKMRGKTSKGEFRGAASSTPATAPVGGGGTGLGA